MAEIQQTLLARGVQVLEAPVGGGVADATQGTLQVLVGGTLRSSRGSETC
jgi:3-hydroxyisobutyrate dehydrogenase-like beta-hydroxyacid dehydrogenase